MRVRTLGSEVDAVTLNEASDFVLNLLARDTGAARHTALESQTTVSPCRYVVTPNLDHAVQLTENQSLRAAYQDAALVVADGMPLVWAARLQRKPLPERVTGSDLTPRVLRDCPTGTRVFLLGAAPQSSKKAATRIAQLFPQVDVVGRSSPPRGFEASNIWSDSIIADIQDSNTQLILIGFGAPKQEIWVHRHREALAGTVALCVGATIDFFAGEQARAPVWAQKSGLEWVHRLSTNPKRLTARYARDAVYFPALLAKDIFSSKDATSG